MSTNFVVTSKDNPQKFYDNVSKGDVVTYHFDFSPWQDDNSTITSIVWTLESGNASISNQVLTSGVAAALVSFPQEGRNTISVLAVTANEQKKIFINIIARDQQLEFPIDGYGYCGNG